MVQVAVYASHNVSVCHQDFVLSVPSGLDFRPRTVRPLELPRENMLYPLAPRFGLLSSWSRRDAYPDHTHGALVVAVALFSNPSASHGVVS